ncbi:unnamed protein product [Echinostoma caproni]|uniref:Neuron navigator 2 n=1 Tax=Echinostoma caproni TaxID=27848 RepID=A0A183AQG2_9TREM|nr:unnamed protein product [Echinostoma caproni]
MNRVIHQVRMTVDLSSTSDNSNVGLNSTASEAAQHRLKMTQLRKEFLSSPGLPSGNLQQGLSTHPSMRNSSVSFSRDQNPDERVASVAFVQRSDTYPQGSFVRDSNHYSTGPQSTDVNQRSHDCDMDTQLNKMHVTLKDFNAHLSQIDSTLGRIQSCGTLNQYLGSISDSDAEAEADLAEPDWNPKHTPSPPMSNFNQPLTVPADNSSSRSDAGKSFECDTGIVTAHRTNEFGRRTTTLSSSLGASLSTLSSSVWSSLSPSTAPANGTNSFVVQTADTKREKNIRYHHNADMDDYVNGIGFATASRLSHMNSRTLRTTETGSYLEDGLHGNETRELHRSVFDNESWPQADSLRFADSTTSSPSYDSGRPTLPSNEGTCPSNTGRFAPVKQPPSYATWSKQSGRSTRFHHPPPIGTVGKMKHIRIPDAHFDASRTFSQPSLAVNGSAVHGRSHPQTAYSITVINPEDQSRMIHASKSYSTNRLPIEDTATVASSVSHSPQHSYSSPSSTGSRPSSPSCSSNYSADSSRSGFAHSAHLSSVDNLIGHLNRLLRTGQEHQARRVIGRLLDTPRSRRKLDCMVAELTSRSRVLDEQPRYRQGSYRSSDSGSHASMHKLGIVGGHRFSADHNNNASPTGSLLRLANSLISARSQLPCTRKPQRGSLTSLQSYSRAYDSEYDLSTQNLSDQTKFRPTLASVAGMQPSISPGTGSMTSLRRSSTVGRSRSHIPWSPGEMVEQPPPAMRPQPRPAAPTRPKATILPTEQTLRHLDIRASEVASSFTYTSFADLARALVNDMTDEVHIIRSLFTWTVTVDTQSNEFNPTAPAESLVGMLRRIRCGQLSRNHLLHKLCRYVLPVGSCRSFICFLFPVLIILLNFSHTVPLFIVEIPLLH